MFYEIGRRQHVHLLVAIEDDQIELIELLVEELADREGDQRRLADRRAVLLLRRPQDREMDEIVRPTGPDFGMLRQVRSPDAARPGQQDLEPVAHAVDDQRGAVVVDVSSCGPALTRRLDDIRSAMIDRHGQRHILADRDSADDGVAAVLAGELRRTAAAIRQVFDTDIDLHLFADEAEARCIPFTIKTIRLVRLAGQQRMQRCVEAERAPAAACRGFRHR